MLYLRNNTSEVIFDSGGTGIAFSPSELVQIIDFKINSEFILSQISNGNLSLTDGTSDYYIDEAINQINWSGVNFAYKQIDGSRIIIVPRNQQMIIRKKLKVYGILKINGDVIVE